jgi:hypothetical protein
MSEIQQEAVPSAFAVGFSSYGDVCVGTLVDVFDNVLEAPDTASNAASNSDDCSVATTIPLSL